MDGAIHVINNQSYTIKQATFSVAATTTEVVAAVAGKRIRVIAAFWTAITSTAVGLVMKSTTTTANATPEFFCITTGGPNLMPFMLDIFTTTVGEGLTITTTASTAKGILWYVEY